MIEQILLLIGAALFGVLGTIHLIYTFLANKFMPRKQEVVEAMKETSLVLTKETTMWKAWIGFNASHSLGAIVFSVFYILLSIQHMDVINETKGFIWLAVINSFAYLFLAKKYWFTIPFIGILMATVSFLASAILIYI